MNRLEDGGVVPLWSGWRIHLPPACFERNEGGAWSAWGADWTFDVSIVDASGRSDGKPITALELRGAVDSKTEILGKGWIGSRKRFDEIQDGKKVHRLSAELCAQNTVMVCTVSFFDDSQQEFANSLLASVEHIPSKSASQA